MTISSSLLLAALAGCSSADSKDYERGGADYDTDVDAYEPDDGDTFTFDTAGGSPPETETDRLNLRPAQTEAYVFVANPERDTVTRIHVQTRDVRTVRVGHLPRVVAITPDYRRAVVFNRGDDSVSVIEAEKLQVDHVAVRDNLTNMVLAPGGAWAVLWHDPGAIRKGDPPVPPAASFHEVSLVHTETLAHVPLVVGFIPTAVRFTPDGRRAVVASDAQLAVVDLSLDVPTLELVDIADPLDPPLTEEIVLDPSGRWAFLRQRDRDVVAVVDLEQEIVGEVAVGADPTDLDLTPDGTRAVVVSRGAGEVTVLDVADPFAPPTVVPFPVGAGSLGAVLLGPDETGILYTTATAASRYATWDLTTQEIIAHPLVKPAQVVARTPTGDSLLVVHTRDDAPDGSTPVPYRGKDAISLVSLKDFRANTIALQAEPIGYANSRDGRRGYLVLEDTPLLAVLDYSSLIHTPLTLRSNAVFVGVLPDLDPSDGDQPPAWVSQEHSLGRISFYDPDASSLETITGFELNSAIEE
ncbi:MAG: hypothetical protein H6732_19860 [Alphaproteobacteria bacterium]|nr:hypothetical protein [Alphaproteobacteria bacterium]